MAGKQHPYIAVLTASSIVFFGSVLIIAFLALYVRSVVAHGDPLPPAAVERNLQGPAKVYYRPE